MDYDEGTAIRYTAMDTGNFTFTISNYKSSATYITEKMKQDAFYTSKLVSSFVPKQNRAIQKAMEVDILAVGPNAQTASNTNAINGAPHRWIGSGTSQVIGVQDFINARLSLRKALVPMTNLIAVVDPTTEQALASLSNIVTVSNNPMWEGIVRDGMSTGMQFKFNIYGFDVYVSDNLVTGLTETIDAGSGSRSVSGTGVANLFFSAASDALPFVGAIRQAPKVDSEFNKDFQREEYVTTCRYGVKLYRPENLVTVITNNTLSF